MGMSVGELFVNLGFNVDDKKLKGFNEELKTGFDNATKFTLAAAGAGATIGALLNNASGRAVELQNLNIQTGQSIEFFQKFAAVVQKTNPAETFESGLAAAKSLNNYLTEAKMGQRSTVELGMLGVNFDANMTDDDVRAALQKSLPQIMKKYDPSIVAGWVKSVFGTAGVIQALTTTPAQYDTLGLAGITDPDKSKQLNEYASAVKNLDTAWMHFETTLGSEFAGPASTAIDLLTKLIAKTEEFDAAVPGAAKHASIMGMGALSAIGGRGTAALAGLVPGGASSFIGGAASLASGAGFLAAYGSIPWVASDAGAWIAEQIKSERGGSSASRAVDFFTGRGWSKEQSQGLVARLMKESGLDPRAMGDGGAAAGIAQWHPDRQANFKQYSGKDISQSTLEDQLGFVNYELTQGTEKRAGTMLKGTTSARAAEGVAAGYYERPAITQNITMHIQGGNAQETGEEVMRQMEQTTNNVAYSQRDLGPDH